MEARVAEGGRDDNPAARPLQFTEDAEKDLIQQFFPKES